MSRYTSLLRYYIEMNSTDSNNWNDRIKEARTKLFDFDYPIWDDSYKQILETKIIKHYLFSEIGFETMAQFKFYLDMKLNEIMPKYNKLYQSLLKYDDIISNNYHYTDTTDNAVSTGTSTNTSQHVESDTPQAKLGTTDYASFITEDNTNTSNNNESEKNTHVVGGGVNGPIAELLELYQEKYNDIDVLIINELNTLFFDSILLY